MEILTPDLKQLQLATGFLYFSFSWPGTCANLDLSFQLRYFALRQDDGSVDYGSLNDYFQHILVHLKNPMEN